MSDRGAVAHPSTLPNEGVAHDGGGAPSVRPATVCAHLLAAMEGSEGRRKRRKRNTTADSIGMAIKRDLLEGAAEEDPAPEQFEGWLLERCLRAGGDRGATRAMAIDILHEWRLAQASPDFRHWLQEGAPSDDTRTDLDR